MSSRTQDIPQSTADRIKEWFDSLVHGMRSDELQLNTGTASEEKAATYDALMHGNIVEIAALNYNLGVRTLIPSLSLAYLSGLVDVFKALSAIAISFSGTTLLVWAETLDDDDDATRATLYELQAKLNAKLEESTFQVDTMIVEKSDNLAVPSHYLQIPLSDLP